MNASPASQPASQPRSLARSLTMNDGSPPRRHRAQLTGPQGQGAPVAHRGVPVTGASAPGTFAYGAVAATAPAPSSSGPAQDAGLSQGHPSPYGVGSFSAGAQHPSDDSPFGASRTTLDLAYAGTGTPLDPSLQDLDDSGYGANGQPSNDVFATPSVPRTGAFNGNESFNLNTPDTRAHVPAIHRATETPGGGDDAESSGNHARGMYRIPYPPHLDIWRQRLFDVDGTFMLSEDQYVPF